MKKIKLETIFKEYDENGELVDETIGTAYQLTPDDGKCFQDKATGEKFIRQNDGNGAIIEVDQSNLDKYEEVEI